MAKADLSGILAIESENLSPWSQESLAGELEIRQAIQLVAVAPEGEILGWCACRMIWPEAELLKIAVRQKDRERGVGRFLLEQLLAELHIRKATTVFLEVRSNNRTALAFYEKHGFLHVGFRPGYYSDPPDDAMILRKNLSS